MANRNTRPRNVNPVARSLRSPALKVRIVKPKKGKGSYRRTRTNGGDV